MMALPEKATEPSRASVRPGHSAGAVFAAGAATTVETEDIAVDSMNASRPLPRRGGMLSAVAFQRVRLSQTGRELERQGRAPAETGQQLMSYASGVYDEICGSVPISVLIAWLLPHKPPPPPPWLREIEQ